MLVSFRHGISSICKRKVIQIDPEFEKNLKFLSFLMQFLYIFLYILSKFQSNQLNNKRMSYALHFLERTLQHSASKILQIDSKAIEKFQHLRFCANTGKIENFHVFLNKFRPFFVQSLSFFLAKNGYKNSTLTNPGISSRQFCRDKQIFCGICLKNTQKLMKQQKNAL